MAQNPDSFPGSSDSEPPKLFDIENEPRTLDELPLGFNDGSSITQEDLGLIARTYFGAIRTYERLRVICNMDGLSAAQDARNRAQGKPPFGI